MTKGRRDRLRSTQRQMLRRMLGSGRRRVSHESVTTDSESESDEACPDEDSDSERDLEPWVERIQRVTHTAEEAARLTGIRDWVVEQSRRRWIWAGHVIRRTDQRWSKATLEWQPDAGSRRRGHPDRRWEDDINDFLATSLHLDAGDWRHLAQDRASWDLLAMDFANFYH